MPPQVATEDGKVLMEVEGASPCSATLDATEALNLARDLIAAVVDVAEPAPVRRGLVLP